MASHLGPLGTAGEAGASGAATSGTAAEAAAGGAAATGAARLPAASSFCGDMSRPPCLTCSRLSGPNMACGVAWRLWLSRRAGGEAMNGWRVLLLLLAVWVCGPARFVCLCVRQGYSVVVSMVRWQARGEKGTRHRDAVTQRRSCGHAQSLPCPFSKPTTITAQITANTPAAMQLTAQHRVLRPSQAGLQRRSAPPAARCRRSAARARAQAAAAATAPPQPLAFSPTSSYAQAAASAAVSAAKTISTHNASGARAPACLPARHVCTEALGRHRPPRHPPCPAMSAPHGLH
jgi:hypothetical protein